MAPNGSERPIFDPKWPKLTILGQIWPFSKVNAQTTSTRWLQRFPQHPFNINSLLFIFLHQPESNQSSVHSISESTTDIVLGFDQTWNLSKILHRRIFGLKILHHQFHLISTVLVRKNTTYEWKWRNLHCRHWRHGQIPPLGLIVSGPKTEYFEYVPTFSCGGFGLPVGKWPSNLYDGECDNYFLLSAKTLFLLEKNACRNVQ